MLLDATAIGLENQCYLGIYKVENKSTSNNVYYFGSPFFEQYYVSFSLEGYDNFDADNQFLNVAMGPICTTANLGDVVFNKDY